MTQPSSDSAAGPGGKGTRLTSWKEIAAHLGVTVRTAQRWEAKEGLPVHRHGHQARATAFAFSGEMDRWREKRSTPPTVAQPILPETLLIRPSARVTVAGPDLSSIAVLPFANVGQHPDNDYFSAGLTEELIHGLSQLQGIRVVGRTSAFSLKMQGLGAKEIGRMLNVATILEGSVRRSNDRVRVTAQLVGVEDGFQLWSKRYDHRLEDIFDVQDDVANAIRDSLQATLDSGGQTIREVARTVDMAAYDLYLKGRFYSNHWTPLRLREAAVCFEGALRLDPSYVPAWAGLAKVHRTLAYWGTVFPKKGWAASRRAAERGLALDPSSAEIHLGIGAILAAQDHDWEAAERHLRTAIELSPSLSLAHEILARYYFLPTGQTESARKAIERAIELDPASPTPLIMMAWVQTRAHEWEAVLKTTARALHLYPGSPEALWAKAISLDQLGRYEEAMDSIRQSEIQAPGHQMALAAQGIIRAHQGRVDEAKRLYEQLLKRSKTEWISSAALSWVPLFLGDFATGVAHLKKSIADREAFALAVRGNCLYAPLRGRKEYAELLALMHLPLDQ